MRVYNYSEQLAVRNVMFGMIMTSIAISKWLGCDSAPHICHTFAKQMLRNMI